MVAPTKDEITSLFDAHAQGISVSAEKARNYDDARTWVDPNGYRLSDRIWNGREANREQINQILRDGVANRQDALVTAKQLEQFLNPAHAVVRNEDGRIVKAESKGLSKTVRGRGGTGSHAARRLAVTEVSRAHAQEVGRVARETPFATGERWNLSPQHPKTDHCDDQASANVGLGPGVYPVDGFPRLPDHPWCMCYATIETADDATVIKALRQEFGLADGPGLEALDRPMSSEVPGADAAPSINKRYTELKKALDTGQIKRDEYLKELKELKDEVALKKQAKKLAPDPDVIDTPSVKVKAEPGIPDDDLTKTIDERVMGQRDLMFSGKIDYTEYERRERLIRASTPEVTEIPIITASTTKLEKAIVDLVDDSSAVKRAEARGWSPQMAREDAEKWIEGGAFKVDEPIFHFTKEEYVDSILQNGLRGTDGTYGHGVYTTLDKVGDHTGRDGLPVRLELRINMKNPLRTKYYNGNKTFFEALGDANITSTADINRILKAQGYDGIILDMDGIISDWVWAFDTEAITVVDVKRGAELAKDLAQKGTRRIDSILNGPIPRPTSVPTSVIDDLVETATELSINKRYTILKGQLDAGSINRETYLKELKALKDEAALKKAGGKVVPKPDPLPTPRPPVIDKPPMPDPGLSISKQYEILKDQQAKGLITRQDYLERLDVLKQRKTLGKATPKPAPKPEPKATTVRKVRPTTPEPVVLKKTGDPFVDKVQARIAKGLNTEADVREVGALIREEIKASMLKSGQGASSAQIRDVESRIATLTERYKELVSKPSAKRTRSEMEDIFELTSRQNDLLKELAKLKAGTAKVDQTAVVRDVLNRVRPLGKGKDKVKFLKPLKVDQKALDAVQEAMDYIPSDWLGSLARDFEATGRQFQAQQTARGFYDHNARNIAISGNGVHAVSTAVHELGHVIELLRPQVMKYQREFFARRTKDEVARSLGAGYRTDEVTKRDKFLNPYMGKQYSQHYELLTMGMESLLTPGFTRYDMIKDDTDMADFILGLLGGI